MKILLVDNGTIHIDDFKIFLVDYKVDIVNCGDLNVKNAKNYDAVILSGSSHAPMVWDNKDLSKEIELIKNFDGPIIGICYGFEMIAYYFGCEINNIGEKLRGIYSIKANKKEELFKNVDEWEVFEGHRYVVTMLSDIVEGLARSKYGYEAIKVKDRPIYGFQFHPEVNIENIKDKELFHVRLSKHYPVGSEILQNLLDQLRKK